ncbi:MAG TPA: hypothetical protein VK474_04435 [Chthoniobacterales bacterium]|nr:hypothetical protein [Chthoniobacterales bacterium]
MKALEAILLIGLLALGSQAAAQTEEASSDRNERLHFTEKDLPSTKKDPNGPSEIDESARAHGFDYATGTRRAARGDFKLLKKFFQLAHDVDGAAAESFGDMSTVVYHLVGDEKFAQFLSAQPLAFRMMVRNGISHEGYPAPASEYLSRHFPQTTQLLFRREMIDWSSPNDQFAIRKTFTSDLQLVGSKVERAELIEKKTGRVLCDLTADDIGTGGEREGEALWSPDSQRVACLSSDLPPQPGNAFNNPSRPTLRKQTAVYLRSGDSFTRVDLSLGEAPGHAADKELEGAKTEHIFTEPVRWRKPNILLLTRHEYYQKMMPTVIENLKFDSIHDLERQYEITATFAADGKANVVWKPSLER